MLLVVHDKTLKALVKLVELDHEMTPFCMNQRFSPPLLAPSNFLKNRSTSRD